MRSAEFVDWADGLVTAEQQIEIVATHLGNVPETDKILKHLKAARVSLEKAVTGLGRFIMDPPAEE